jgi:hypothetical protein
VRKVSLKRNEYNTNLTIADFEFGVKLLDTFAQVDTGCQITKSADFGYVYLKQGADASMRCQVILKLVSASDLD